MCRGKFKVDTKKTQGPSHGSTSTNKHRDAALKSREKTPYELRNQELKMEEGNEPEAKS